MLCGKTCSRSDFCLSECFCDLLEDFLNGMDSNKKRFLHSVLLDEDLTENLFESLCSREDF